MANHESGPDTDSGLPEGEGFSSYLAKTAISGGRGAREATTILTPGASAKEVQTAFRRLERITETESE